MITDKLSEYLSSQCKSGVLASLHEECTFYQPVKEKDSLLMEKMWRLEGCIRSSRAVRVSYRRLDGKTVERKLYPVETSFSGYYFYLTAYRSDADSFETVYYRIDRIREMTELEEKVPLEVGERYGKRYYDVPDLQGVGSNAYCFINAVSDFATHARPLCQTANYSENLFIRTWRGTL